MTTETDPSLHDVIAARPHVYQHLRRTPLHHYPTLSELLGANIWLKHENHQPVGAFKVRGGLNLAAGLDDAARNGGLFTASTGNHGQSIAFAARAHGIRATIAVPEVANPGKVAAMRGLGANVVFHGPDFDTAREWVMEEAKREGGYFVGPTDRPLICGVATYALEILEDLPDVDVIIAPVGAGSGVCGCCIVAKSVNPGIKVFGVQSAQAPTQQQTWKAGKPTPSPSTTHAEGMATRVPFENTQRIMGKYLDDFLLVDDTEIDAATITILEHTHNLLEGSSAATLAAAQQLKPQLANKKVVLIASGANLDINHLRKILTE